MSSGHFMLIRRQLAALRLDQQVSVMLVNGNVVSGYVNEHNNPAELALWSSTGNGYITNTVIHESQICAISVTVRAPKEEA